jgi:hypothetical protein
MGKIGVEQLPDHDSDFQIKVLVGIAAKYQFYLNLT